MTKNRVSLFKKTLRRLALTILAGFFIFVSEMPGSLKVSGFAQLPHAGFFARASAAGQDNGNKGQNENGNHGDGNNGNGNGNGDSGSGGGNGDDNGGGNGGGSAGSSSAGLFRGSDPQFNSGGGLSYDANRNMLQLRLKLDGGGNQDIEGSKARPVSYAGQEREGPAWSSGANGRGEKDRSWHPVNDPFHALVADDWQPAKSLETLDKAVKPFETRYRQSIGAQPARPAAKASETGLAIGAWSFSPSEVLAVNLDAASIAHAESLGFKVDPSPPGELPLPIVRLHVPPGLDAIRAQELLSQQLPERRFELNRIYRFYRTAMSGDAGPPKQSEPASPQGSSRCESDHCLARKIIQWKDHLGICARGVRVGIIDTDIDINHPAFAGRHIHRNTFAAEGRPAAPNWHGTGVLSLLAGSPASRTPGLIPDAEFFVAGIFFSEDGGEMAADTVSLLKALHWMESKDVRLINMSFSGPPDELVQEAVERMSAKEVMFVAAAGNEGPTAKPGYPAAYPQVIAVTAVTKDLRNYPYANRGEHIDVAAPGVNIWMAVPQAREGYYSGTSFAAPFVTAVLAILPPETLKPPKDILLGRVKIARLGPHPIYGRGLVQAPGMCEGAGGLLASTKQERPVRR
jgi:hypothetical protein